jgi:hypothetical protein
MRNSFWVLCSIVGLCCLNVRMPEAFAQTNGATLVGSVLDTTGATVPNAPVTVTNQATGNFSKTVTSSEGEYVVTNLDPGSYSVSVNANGFEEETLHNVTLFVNQTARVSLSLHLGNVATKIEVDATEPVVASETSSVGEIVDSRQITQMPLDGRSTIFNLLALAPGVQATSVAQNPAISGGTWYGATNETVDGVSSNDVGNERLSPAAPSLESIEEFKVIANGSSAEFGHGGAQVLIETKSGTNELHGSLFEFNRNRVFTAKNYFATSLPLPPFNRNEFGGSLGGPLKRNKLFYFGSFESLHRITTTPTVDSVPTAAMESGNFSGLSTIVMPGTSTPFPNNQIPSGMISPIATALLAFSPAPNLPGITNNFVYNTPTFEIDNRYTGRVDYQINSSNKITGRYFYAGDGPYLDGVSGATNEYGNYTGYGSADQNAGVTYTHIFSASIVNETIAGFQQVHDYRIPQNSSYDPTKNFPGLAEPAPGLGGLPGITITGYTGFSDPAGSYDTQRDFPVIDNLTWIRGKHALKTGVEYQRVNDNQLQNPAPARGSFSFNGVYTGNAFADFLLGDTIATSKTTGPLISQPQDNRYAAFLQDDWSIARNVTLNLGLRWEYQSPFQQGTGQIANFYPGTGLVRVEGTPNPLLAGLPVVSGDSVNISSKNYMNPDRHNLAPRVGFAYRPLGNGSFVVSSSYGIYYNVVSGYAGAFDLPLNPPFQTVETYTASPGNTPTLTLANPFPGTGTITANPVVYAVDRHRVNSYMQQWNLTLEGEVLRNTAVRASYIGSKGTHLDEQANLDDPGNVVGTVQPYRPYQPWSAVNYYTSNINSSMNQLQLGAVRRMSSGLSAQVEYQFTREFTLQPYGVTAPTDPFDPRYDYGNADFLRRNYVTINFTYMLPFGSGRHFALSGITNTVLGGWQIASIASAGSGQPYSVTFTSKVVGWESSRADLVGSPTGNGTIKDWFNPAAFTLPAPYTYGTSQRNSLFGPKDVNWDQAVYKNWAIKERLNFQFRAEFFNILNHPDMDVPASNISVPSTAGVISDTVNNARDLQFAGRLSF